MLYDPLGMRMGKAVGRLRLPRELSVSRLDRMLFVVKRNTVEVKR